MTRRGRVDLDKQVSEIARLRSEMSAKTHEQRTVTTRAVARIIEDVHLAAVFTGCREAARAMLPRGSGSIINVASAPGLMGSWRMPPPGMRQARAA